MFPRGKLPLQPALDLNNRERTYGKAIAIIPGNFFSRDRKRRPVGQGLIILIGDQQLRRSAGDRGQMAGIIGTHELGQRYQSRAVEDGIQEIAASVDLAENPLAWNERALEGDVRRVPAIQQPAPSNRHAAQAGIEGDVSIIQDESGVWIVEQEAGQ